MDDPYKILGLPRNANDEQIRQRYKKLVKEFHPDVNKSKGAEEQFKKVTSAFEILGDPEKRRSFDRGEINSRGEQHKSPFRGKADAEFDRSHPFNHFMNEDPFSGIFSNFKGANRRHSRSMKGADTRHILEIDFLEAISGARKRIILSSRDPLDLSIPSGVCDRQVLRMRGQGQPGANGGQAGDALIEVHIKPHEIFKRIGNDITCTIPITLDEAILGAKINVPTLNGQVLFTIPAGTNSGQMFRLKGKGVFNSSSGLTGDQLVSVIIMLPSIIDESLRAFFNNWRENHSYDPRTKKKL